MIKVYSTHTCPYCHMLRDWLDEKKIIHETIFVDDNIEAAEEMIKKSGQMGVPVSIVPTEGGKEEVVIGFDKEKISSLLGLEK